MHPEDARGRAYAGAPTPGTAPCRELSSAPRRRRVCPMPPPSTSKSTGRDRFDDAGRSSDLQNAVPFLFGAICAFRCGLSRRAMKRRGRAIATPAAMRALAQRGALARKRRARVDRDRIAHIERLVGPPAVVAAEEVVEARLLLKQVGSARRRARRVPSGSTGARRSSRRPHASFIGARRGGRWR